MPRRWTADSIVLGRLAELRLKAERPQSYYSTSASSNASATTPSDMSFDELVPLQTCQRLVHYRGFGGDADFAEVAVKEDAWKGKDGGKKKGKGGKEAPEPGARNSGRARNFCAPLSQP